MNEIKQEFKNLKCCVLVPTYNNNKTLQQVLSDVLEYSDDVCVVNDGSTDNTSGILKLFPSVKVFAYEQNQGKGYALRKGFEFARENGYYYAITIDSDGQHYASDLPVFIDALKQNSNAIFIGARNMNVENVPGKSSFGNKFSNFWFKLETGITLPDTQSGYRLYPIGAMKNMLFITKKYEFEIETIVKAAWKGIDVIAVPIKVYYPPAEERVSHFRPLKDFTRISILNTFLVLWTFAYIKPRNFLRLLQKKSLSQLLNDYLYRTQESAAVKAASVWLGIFFGIAPFWGFQMLLVAFLAWIFKLNKALALIVSNISIPPMIPIILFLSYKAGEIWMPKDHTVINYTKDLTLEIINKNLLQYILGSLTLATISATIFSMITFFLVKFHKKKTSSKV
jgi:glycosyltransferase involved in cell wall biosynthesis